MKVLTVIFLAATISVALALPWEPEPRTEQYWIARHNGFIQNSLNNNASINILFYGDLHTEGWSAVGRPTFEEYYAPLGVSNYAIGADRIEHTLYRISDGEVTDNIKTKLCVIKMSQTNLEGNDDLEIALGNVILVNDLRERQPNMKILLLGILNIPKNSEEWANRISNINRIMRSLDNGRTIRFLDMNEHFQSEGSFPFGLFAGDLIHLSAAG
ncbi:unnamed protein product [Orchesella dallaii]|uniref:SGNH hydrolase-type esterase domain-containing protein n=1 Tax=Orchesella dallaii TaxID=48710 RepID=A0ABP1R2H6_9HEXA